MNYLNEYEPYAAEWMQNLIDAGEIPAARIDTRSIKDVQPSDLSGYDQCHFFAGIAGWPLALKLAGVPSTFPLWTGSCPCQPFSIAGKGKGISDERHLWPEFFRLIKDCRPAIVFGEQVAGDAGREWLSGVRVDMESMDYAIGASDLCAASVKAPHARQRLWWFAYSTVHGQEGLQRSIETQISQDWSLEALDAWHGTGSPFEHWKEFLAEPHVFRVDDGVSSTVDIRPRLHAYGNAIVPQVAAVFIRAAMESIIAADSIWEGNAKVVS